MSIISVLCCPRLVYMGEYVSDSAYEKGTDMGSSVSRGDGEPLSVDQNEDCQSTPSRIAVSHSLAPVCCIYGLCNI
jgi:hypothetical protein